MPVSRYFSLAAFAALLSLAVSDVYDPDSVCYSYGVDFLDEGSYFINSLSSDPFTSVSTFKGCNTDVADILLVDPDDTEYLCDEIPTTPADTPQLSKCPILKDQMSSGHWILLILGNNGAYPAQPFAWQRDLYLTLGTQVTSTYTPTVTFSTTTVPIATQVLSTTSVLVTEVGPFETVTIPSATAKKTKTITPKAVTTTSTKVMTKTRLDATRVFVTTTKTATATCTTPGRPGKPDKPCHFTPTLLHPAALATPTSLPKYNRYVRRSDRAVDYDWARARVEAAKQKRSAKAQGLERRAPDAPTTTLTAETPISTTTTITAEPTTTTETVLFTQTSTSTLPPATVFSGVFTSTTTLPTPTKTQLRLDWATTTKTITWGATFTKYTTVTPTASVSACKKAGGHFGWN
jgi:hypothetical protein